jgi:hemolysin activation/secretion protein
MILDWCATTRPEFETLPFGRQWETPPVPGRFPHRPSRVVSGVAAFAVALAFASHTAHAQGLPQSALTNPVPQGSPIPRILPPGPPSVSIEGVVPAAGEQAGLASGPPVPITSVVVAGVTVYPASEMAALTQGLTGPAVPFSSIDAARQAILERYRANGYVLSTVSASYDAASGQLRFQVTEGHIATVKLDGDIGPAGTQVLRFLNRLMDEPVIDAVTLERYLLLAQDVPGVTLHAVLQPSTEQPGALNLIAQVSRQAVSGLMATDNRASPFTGPIETLTGLSLNSFTEFGEKTEVSLYHAWPNSQTFGQLSYETFIGSSGLKMQIYGGAGASVPTGPLAAIGYNGVTQVFGAKASYPVIRSRKQNLNTWLSLDGIDSSIGTSSGVGGTPALTSYDAVRVLRLGADYAVSDLLAGDERPGVNGISARLSKGMDILGATSSGTSPTVARTGEQTNFQKFNFQASRTQTLFYPWQGASIGVMGLVTGQWSNSILPPVEEFYLGGAQFTRGYYSGQVAGDKALASTVELQLNTGIDLSRVGLSTEISSQFYVFYDWGEIWQNQAASLASRIASTGGGVRVQATRYVEVDFEGALRLNRFPNGSGPAISALDSGAFYWRVLARF